MGCAFSSRQFTSTSRSRDPTSAVNSAITHTFQTCAGFTPAVRAVRCASSSATQNAGSGQRAIAGDEESSEPEQNRMHWR